MVKKWGRIWRSRFFLYLCRAFLHKTIQIKSIMNTYETVFIATPVLSDVQVKELVSKFQGVITENGGQIVNFEDWGLRKLEYAIEKKTTGFYFFIEFQAEGTLINTLETQYRRDERVIRFLTFKQDKYAMEYAAKRRAKLSGKQVEVKQENTEEE